MLLLPPCSHPQGLTRTDALTPTGRKDSFGRSEYILARTYHQCLICGTIVSEE